MHGAAQNGASFLTRPTMIRLSGQATAPEFALYGQDFADAQVAVERKRLRMYPAAWDFALSFTKDQRAAEWKKVVADRIPR